MTSVCLSQTNYQQQRHQLQLLNGNIMLLQQQYAVKHHQHITPAPSKVLGNSNLHNMRTVSTLGPMFPKKKYTYTNMPYGQQLPSVARRNARERNRVRQVNNGFANLRQHLPQSVINTLSNGGRGASKKLSKVDTLRIAVEYIRGLQDLLDDSPSSNVASLDECSNDDSNYDFSSIGSPVDPRNQLAQHAYHSEVSASPTPSYSDSDISIGGANYLQPLKLEEEQPQEPHQMQFKFEAFENYDQINSDEQPDDEELLDYISSWQEQ